MDPDKPKQTRREAVKRVIKAAVAILIALAALVLLYGLVTQWRGWPAWTGLGDYVTPAVSQGEEYQRGKTLWDLAELLIIPLVLALGAIWFNRQERKTEREIAADRMRENALQEYLDRMTGLLIEKGLRTAKPNEEVRSIALARTLSVMRILDPKRKGTVVQFLHGAGLISTQSPVISLETVSLFKTDLTSASLVEANLDKTGLYASTLDFADLSKARLVEAFLTWNSFYHAKFEKADLSFADLGYANLTGANLSSAKLVGTTFYKANLKDANLTGSIMVGVDLRYANLSGVDLSGANLDRADLQGCRNWTSEQLNATVSLEGAKLPQGYTPPNNGAMQ